MDNARRLGGWEDYFHKDCMRINLNVSDICNFSCSYCINRNVHKKKRILEKDIMIKFIEDLGDRGRESYYFGISGGEPLLYPYLDCLLEKVENVIPSDDKRVCILSNGSLLLKRGEYLYNKVNKTKLTFSISVHLEQIDLNEFCDSIAAFGNSDDVKCKILLSPGNLTQARKAAEMLFSRNIDTFVGPVTSPSGKPADYSEEELKFLNSHIKEEVPIFFIEYDNGYKEYIYRIIKGLHPEKCDFYGMHCLAGRNSLGLGPDGIVRRCFWAGKEYFDLKQMRLRDLPDLNEPCVCSSHFCNCHAFLRMPKWIKDADAPVYL